MTVRGALRSKDHGFHVVSSLVIDGDEDGVLSANWKRIAHVSDFLSKSDELRRPWISLLFKILPVRFVWRFRFAALSKTGSLDFELAE